MVTTMTQDEAQQLIQTIEMFEVITQTQPHDYQSLEILKEAYSKLGREEEAINTSKRIAEAYVQAGQYSSAILEYETILQHHPEDPDVQAALQAIESKAAAANQPVTNDTVLFRKGEESASHNTKTTRKTILTPDSIDDGRKQMYKIFVDGKILAPADFEACWPKPDLNNPPADVVEPFLQVIADKALMPADTALKLLSDRTRIAYLPLDRYELDIQLARTFPAETCRRWGVLPFDRLSKSIMVATANPFNQQAAKELAEATSNRLLWYLVPPSEIIKNLRKIFR
jgi:tetratricopeptide (TPR) repeat protein